MVLQTDQLQEKLRRQIAKQERRVAKKERQRLRLERGDTRTKLERNFDSLCDPQMTAVDRMANMPRLREKVSKRVYRGADEGLSYKQLCRMLEAAKARQNRCCPGGKDQCGREEKRVCCQHVTRDGKQCSRAASGFTSINLSTPTMEPPRWLRQHLSAASFNRLALSLSGMNCCFYCWQHVGAAVVRGAALVSASVFFALNPTVVMRIFFPEFRVERRSVVGIPTSFHVGPIRTSWNLLQIMRDAVAGGQELPADLLEVGATFGSALLVGPFSPRFVFWVVYMAMRSVVFLADKLKGPIVKMVGRENHKRITIESAKALSNANAPAPPPVKFK